MSKLEDSIWDNPEFQLVVKQRNRFMWCLFSLVLVSYFGFALLAIFAPSVFAIPLWPGAATTIGIPMGIGVMFFPGLLTGLYVYRSIRDFDPRIAKLVREAQDEAQE